jgi:hypothetical protein
MSEENMPLASGNSSQVSAGKSENRRLHPWRRSSRQCACHLYWIGVQSFPVPTAQREWMQIFFDSFVPAIRQELGVRLEVFLQMKKVYPNLMNPFLNSAQEFVPMCGLGLRPGASIPAGPTAKDIVEVVEGRKKFSFEENAPDYCYWFVAKAEKKQRALFWGEGGMTLLFLPPDPATEPPPIPFSKSVREHPSFCNIDFEQLQATTYALRDSFREKSKALFGASIQEEPQSKGMPFILPLLQTNDFFIQSEETARNWFNMFDIYVCESPADQGIIIASKTNLDKVLCSLVEQMEANGHLYPLSQLQANHAGGEE